jgi:hypothetical protein
VEERGVHARLLGDLLHARAGGAASGEDAPRPLEDAALGVAIARDGGGSLLTRHFDYLVNSKRKVRWMVVGRKGGR